MGSNHPLSHHTAKFGIHGPYGSGDNGVCNISCNSNSNSNVDVPMPRFTSGRYWLAMELIKVPVLLPSGCFISLPFHSPCFICNVSNCDQRDHTLILRNLPWVLSWAYAIIFIPTEHGSTVLRRHFVRSLSNHRVLK